MFPMYIHIYTPMMPFDYACTAIVLHIQTVRPVYGSGYDTSSATYVALCIFYISKDKQVKILIKVRSLRESSATML